MSLDEMMDALAAERRRELLMSLLERQPEDDPTIVVADADPDVDVLAMQHAHLPKLAAYGFIDWNRETDEVTAGPKFDDIQPLLELLTDHEDELPADWT
ncbi:ArsR family transcriptional regulator [Halobellus ruber]|uniref:ArsR family transcriptional regulator n=1 Tax=Halobellus ruber TaxID=2761102 RepID=A0A7J9SE00_9EURY|nr:ArsR family transcriptional regulator [Halobellus ruber]MBB6644968.1 ArsR family transcriptional regulator [Halobellus ruber]